MITARQLKELRFTLEERISFGPLIKTPFQFPPDQLPLLLETVKLAEKAVDSCQCGHGGESHNNADRCQYGSGCACKYFDPAEVLA